jgi:hypothetical protein
MERPASWSSALRQEPAPAVSARSKRQRRIGTWQRSTLKVDCRTIDHFRNAPLPDLCVLAEKTGEQVWVIAERLLCEARPSAEACRGQPWTSRSHRGEGAGRIRSRVALVGTSHRSPTCWQGAARCRCLRTRRHPSDSGHPRPSVLRRTSLPAGQGIHDMPSEWWRGDLAGGRD